MQKTIKVRDIRDIEDEIIKIIQSSDRTEFSIETVYDLIRKRMNVLTSEDKSYVNNEGNEVNALNDEIRSAYANLKENNIFVDYERTVWKVNDDVKVLEKGIEKSQNRLRVESRGIVKYILIQLLKNKKMKRKDLIDSVFDHFHLEKTSKKKANMSSYISNLKKDGFINYDKFSFKGENWIWIEDEAKWKGKIFPNLKRDFSKNID